MTRRRNPYPGTSRATDRHGKVRWRFRMKGLRSTYIAGEWGSVEFVAGYQMALKGTIAPKIREAARGSFDWLIIQYLQTPDWRKLAPITRRNLGGEIERFRTAHGQRMLAELRPVHVEALIGRLADTPAAANKLLKLIRRLCRYALRIEALRTDPTIGIKPFRTNPDGYRTWSDAEIAQFEAHHGLGSMAVLALRLAIYTGAARQDLAALGWQNVRDGRISYRRHKTGGEVDLPIHEDLAKALDFVPRDRMLFIVHTGARGYNAATFGNWFADQVRDAGLSGIAAHGLRKAGATRLAEDGCTELEIMAYLGHRTPNEARTYVKRASRAKLGDGAMSKMRGLSNRVERLDNHRRKALTEKGN